MDIVVGRTGVIGTVRGSSSRQALGVITVQCVLYQPPTVASSSVSRRKCPGLSAGFRYIVVSEKRKLKGSFSSVISGVDPAFSRTASLHWAKMSITSDEVNFLVYRYLQESGLSHLHLIVNTPQFTLGRRDALYILKKKHVYETV